MCFFLLVGVRPENDLSQSLTPPTTSPITISFSPRPPFPFHFATVSTVAGAHRKPRPIPGPDTSLPELKRSGEVGEAVEPGKARLSCEPTISGGSGESARERKDGKTPMYVCKCIVLSHLIME